jgi:hypothetical protein
MRADQFDVSACQGKSQGITVSGGIIDKVFGHPNFWG